MSGTDGDAGGQHPDLPVRFADCWISPEARTAADQVLSSGWVTQGPQVAAFEDEFAAVVGARHAVAVSSCTAAIELALRSLHLPAGSPVLVPTLTFCGAVSAVVAAGLSPVLVDVDPETGLATTHSVRRAARAYGAAALMVLHWAGDPVDVRALATAAGVPPSAVIVDGAHALGSSWGHDSVGSDFTTCFSFYATKNLPIGEGGMVTTPDAEQAEWLRSARLHGLSADAWKRYLPGGDWRYDVLDAGMKANMTDVQAAIGRAQLGHLGTWQDTRAELAARYDRQLAMVHGVRLPHRPGPVVGRHAWHLYPVRITAGSGTTRDRVMAALRERHIGSSVHFIPVHRLTHFRRVCRLPANGFPGADRLCDQVISLPLHPRMTADQVDTVCRAIADALPVRSHRSVS